LLSLGSAVTGAGIALFASGTKAQPTDTRVAGVLVGIGILAFAVYGLLAWREAVSHNKPALDLVFEGSHTPCAYRFKAPGTGELLGTHFSTAVPAVSGSASPGPSGPPGESGPGDLHTTVRLHVKNLRSRTLHNVTVRVTAATVGGRPLEHCDYLKWMHDDDSHVRSLQGGTVQPDDDPHAYIDLATKNHTHAVLALEFAQQHLRRLATWTGPAYVRLLATGREEDGRQVPDCERGFLIEIAADGGLNVTLQPASSAARPG
jgi:hypothetical protein